VSGPLRIKSLGEASGRFQESNPRRRKSTASAGQPSQARFSIFHPCSQRRETKTTWSSSPSPRALIHQTTWETAGRLKGKAPAMSSLLPLSCCLRRSVRMNLFPAATSRYCPDRVRNPTLLNRVPLQLRGYHWRPCF
jgi:hypothetical protein